MVAYLTGPSTWSPLPSLASFFSSSQPARPSGAPRLAIEMLFSRWSETIFTVGTAMSAAATSVAPPTTAMVFLRSAAFCCFLSASTFARRSFCGAFGLFPTVLFRPGDPVLASGPQPSLRIFALGQTSARVVSGVSQDLASGPRPRRGPDAGPAAPRRGRPRVPYGRRGRALAGRPDAGGAGDAAAARAAGGRRGGGQR